MARQGTTRKKQNKKPREIPTVRIGKYGASVSLINEVVRHLDQSRRVKVKILETGLTDEGTEEIAQKISKETESKVIQIRGHTFTLLRLKKRSKKI